MIDISFPQVDSFVRCLECHSLWRFRNYAGVYNSLTSVYLARY